MSERSNYWTRKASRRKVLGAGATVVAAGAGFALVGCGDDDDGGAATPGSTTSPTTSGSPAASASVAVAKPSGSINVSVSTMAEQSTSPFFQTSGNAYVLYSHYTEGFYGVGLDGRPEPRLAEGYELIDPLTLRFKMRKGIKFSDGTPVTADDIRWSFEAYTTNDPAAPPALGLKKAVDKIETPDDSTVVVKMVKPSTFAMEELSVPGAPRGWPIASRAYFEKNGADALKTTPVTTAPFHITKNVKGQYVEMEANEFYYLPDRVSRVKTVRVNLVPEQQTRLAQIKTGEADIIEGIIGAAAEALKSESNIRIVDTKGVSQLSVRFFDLWDPNTNSVQKDPRFREALVISVDQEQVAKSLLKIGSPSPNVIAFESQIGFDKTVNVPPKRDVARAKALIKEAGAEGTSFKLGAYKSSSYPLIPEVCQVYASFWKEIGVDVKIEEQEAGAYITAFQAHSLRGLGAVSFPNQSNGMMLVAYFKQGQPYSTLDNFFPEVQAIIAQLEKELDPKRQEELIKQANKAIMATNAIIPAPYMDGVWAVGKKIKDWRREAGRPYVNSLNTVVLA